MGKLENKKAWNRLRLVLNDFYQQKNEFYKERKNTLKNEVDKKIALCEQAEALKDSTDWKRNNRKNYFFTESLEKDRFCFKRTVRKNMETFSKCMQ